MSFAWEYVLWSPCGLRLGSRGWTPFRMHSRRNSGSFAKEGRRDSAAGKAGHHDFADGRDALGTHMSLGENTLTTKKGFTGAM